MKEHTINFAIKTIMTIMTALVCVLYFAADFGGKAEPVLWSLGTLLALSMIVVNEKNAKHRMTAFFCFAMAGMQLPPILYWIVIKGSFYLKFVPDTAFPICWQYGIIHMLFLLYYVILAMTELKRKVVV